MKRGMLALAALTLAVAALAACGDDDGGSSSEEHGGGHEAPSAVAEGAREITVEADSFAFDPSELTVAAGEDVAIVLTSDDVFHDFQVEGVDGHVGSEPDETMTGGFHFAEPGEYTYFCSVSGHRAQGMEGTITVT